LTIPLSTARADSSNLIANPSVETADNTVRPQGWSSNSWGDNTASFTYEDGGHTGNKSLYVTVSDYTSGDAKWMADTVPATPGQSYTYSDYYKSDVSTELDAAFTDAAGTMSFLYLDTLPASSTAWQQTSHSFTVPMGVASVSVYHIVVSSGWLQTDDFSLTQNSVVVPPANTNLIANPSFETADGSLPADWQTGAWGTNDPAFSYTSDGHTGSKSVTVTMNSYTDGDAKWYANPVSITSGETYTYSDYYKSGVATRVVAAFTGTDGVDSYMELPGAPASTGWAQYQTALTAPTSAVKVTIYHLLDKVGTLMIDDVSLALPTEAPSSPIANPSFETADGNTPADWQKDQWGTNTASFTYESGDAHTGTKSAKVTVTNYESGDAKWYFTPLTTLTPGSQYAFSAWYKTNTQPHAVVMYTDASDTEQYFNMPNPLPNGSTTDWQHYNSTFDVPDGATSVTIFMLISSNGWLQTDDYAITPYTPVGFNEPIISLTFDDGWSSIYTNGLPLLKKYGFTSTQYIISGKLNTANYMTTAMVQAFQNHGDEIGSHTITHPDLAQLTPAQLSQELGGSQTALQQLFGADAAQDFASPYGSYNPAVLAGIQGLYRSHRSTDAGYNSKDNFNPYDIRVQNVDTDTTPTQVAAWVAKAKSDNTWLVLVFHQVSNSSDPDDYAVSPANLDTELANIQASGVPVKTVTQALDEITSQL